MAEEKETKDEVTVETDEVTVEKEEKIVTSEETETVKTEAVEEVKEETKVGSEEKTEKSEENETVGAESEDIAKADSKQEEASEGEVGKKKNPIGIILSILSVILLVVAAGIVALSVLSKTDYEGTQWYEQDVKKVESYESIERDEVVEVGSDSIADDWTYGRTYLSYDYTSDDEFYYICNPVDNSFIYKVNKNDMSKECIAKVPGSSINLCNGKLYFVNDSDDTEEPLGFYCIDLSDDSIQMISEDILYSVMSVNEWIYYRNSYDNNIYKYNTVSKLEYQLTNTGEIYAMRVEGNTIFYNYYDREDEKYCFCSMDVNGDNYQMLTGYSEDYSSFLIDNGSIEYCIEDEGVYRVEGEDPKVVVFEGNIYTTPIKDGNKYYYIDASQNRNVACYDVNSDSLIHYDVENAKTYEIVDDILIIEYLDEDNNPLVVAINKNDGKIVELFE